MNLITKCVVVVGVLSLCSNPLSAFNREDVEIFISEYASWAIDEMNNSGVPASIILAQSILESQCGRSVLTTSGNNFFGIKCNNWDGESIYKIDDDRDKNGELIPSCFRKYESPKESFEDHTTFLIVNDRYNMLFELNEADFVGWAHGLKSCGYATDPKYGFKLVSIIERYHLFEYDQMAIDLKMAKEMKPAQASELSATAQGSLQHWNENKPVESFTKNNSDYTLMGHKVMIVHIRREESSIPITSTLPETNEWTFKIDSLDHTPTEQLTLKKIVVPNTIR